MAELQLPKLITRVRFPSSAPSHQLAFIAQAVERIHGKDEVTGSNPVKGSTRKSSPSGELFLYKFRTQGASMVRKRSGSNPVTAYPAEYHIWRPVRQIPAS